MLCCICLQFETLAGFSAVVDRLGELLDAHYTCSCTLLHCSEYTYRRCTVHPRMMLLYSIHLRLKDLFVLEPCSEGPWSVSGCTVSC
jgi:hypothetical protein